MTYGPHISQAAWENNLVATPSGAVPGTQLVGHATPHSKGAWSTIIASTARDICGFWVHICGPQLTATATDMMFDMALGAAQENVFISEFPCGWYSPGGIAGGGTGGGFLRYFPIFIPRGVQVSARVQSLIASDTCEFLFYGNSGASGPLGACFTRCDPYGTTVASTTLTSHTAGNAGAESTAANVGGTLSRHYGAVTLGVAGTTTVLAALSYHFELQVGAVTRGEWLVGTTATETVGGPFPLTPLYCSLPSGTQLQVRGECSGTADVLGISFHCFG
jgi:hypothetical protein